MLVWSVHGHGAVVTRNSWKDREGGKSNQGQRTNASLGEERGRGGPSQLWISPGLEGAPQPKAVVQGCAHTALGSPTRPNPAAVRLMARRVCTAICPCIPQLGHLGSGSSLLCGTAVAAVLG